jgi:hypothetical protein
MNHATAPLGIVMLCHTALHRAAQVARFWLDADCPVVIHVDKAVSPKELAAFQADLGAHPLLRFCDRHRCEWGTWPIVAATQDASERMLQEFPQVEHVLLISGACLPLRPAAELIGWLARHRGRDFIESIALGHSEWIAGGLSMERFTLHFPLSWRRHRWAFDRLVDVQRWLKITREVPRPLRPHLGSQWWCLSRQTLSAILTHPRRRRFDRYFARTWIPDEGYFQTLARLVSDRIDSRSLTLVKFDRNGRPNLFYDDHLQLLRRSDCFIARKIWPEAEALYAYFLSGKNAQSAETDPQPMRIARYFDLAARQRTEGRAGLYMQSRFPAQDPARAKTAAPYSVLCGFDHLYPGFDFWLGKVIGSRVHGHLYSYHGVEFHGGAKVYHGALSASTSIRDYNPRMFLTNLIWATRGEEQVFFYDTRDRMDPELNWFMATDSNARISVISGSWVLPLFRGYQPNSDLLEHVGWLHRREQEFLRVLRSKWTTAQVRIWSLADYLDDSDRNLRKLVRDIVPDPARTLHDLPRPHDLTGMGDYLNRLRNLGLPASVFQDFQQRSENRDTSMTRI